MLFHQVKNNGAFSAILGDGTIQSWRADGCGGVAPERTWEHYFFGTKAISIASTSAAFTVIFNDGTMQSWGAPDCGGVLPDSLKNKKVVFVTGTNE